MNSWITFGIHVLEWMFLAGWAISIVVLLMTGVEDVKTILMKDEPGTH